MAKKTEKCQKGLKSAVYTQQSLFYVFIWCYLFIVFGEFWQHANKAILAISLDKLCQRNYNFKLIDKCQNVYTG